VLEFQDALLRCTTHRHQANNSSFAKQFGGIDQLPRDIAQALLF
jgi:hypothetical protein